MITEPESLAGLQVPVDELVPNLQPGFSKPVNGNDVVNMLVKNKDGEDADGQDIAKENFTHESSSSDCEIIEDEDSSESMKVPTQISPRIDAQMDISYSLPPSATNTNLEKRLTRSSEHVYSRPTRLTSKKLKGNK